MCNIDWMGFTGYFAWIIYITTRTLIHPTHVLFPAISWGITRPPPRIPNSLSQKNTQNTKKHIEKCIEFTPPPPLPDMSPRTGSPELTLIRPRSSLARCRLFGHMNPGCRDASIWYVPPFPDTGTLVAKLQAFDTLHFSMESRQRLWTAGTAAWLFCR